MNICIDVRPALSRPTGVGNYIQNLIQALTQIDSENHYYLFSSSWKERHPAAPYSENFEVADRRWPVKLLNYTWNHFSWPKIEQLLGNSVQVAHSPTPLLIPTRRARRVTTVHDLYFFEHPEHTIREMKTDYPRMIRKHCLSSDAIIAVSDHTKNRLIELLQIPSSRIYTIRHGVDPYYCHKADGWETKRVLEKFQLERPFLLFVGTLEPRKNISVLLQAIQNLGDRVFLVIAGQTGWSADTTDFPENSRLTGYVSKQELRVLYQRALAVVFPSLEEGFGLPLLESMASGAPLVASRIPAFQEVCNDSCLYFDPLDPDDLTETIRAVVDSEPLREELIEKGKERVRRFSWKNTAQKTLDLYMSL